MGRYRFLKTTKELEHPILQLKHKTKNGFRTLSPLGEWFGTYFSEELYNSEKVGYEYQIYSGYLFERHNVFSEFIKELYQIKESHNKSDP